MKPVAILLLFTLPALSLPGAAGQVYRWTDAQGKTYFSDQPPPLGAKNPREQTVKTGAPVVQAPKTIITLYTTTTCGKPCDDAKAYLAKRGVSYTSKDPATDVTANEALRANGATPRVPTLMLDGDKLEGFSESAWNYALKKSGFPAPDDSKK